MAIYHLSVKPVSRGGGRSATAAAAYRAAELVHDHTSGETFDYTRKRGVEHTEIVLPTSAARRDINWARDREALWNEAERAENRSNSRVAREYEIALPHELTKAQRLVLVRGFASEIANRHGVAVDFAIHAPHREGDERNHHAHLLATTRVIEAGGLGEKATIEWSDTNRRKAELEPARKEIEAIRERWAALINEKLLEQGHEARVDHRSLAAQGIEREPTSHLGPAVAGMERRGIATEVGKRLGREAMEAAQQRLERAAEIGRIEREARALSASILDLSGNIMAARQERDRTQSPFNEASPQPTPARSLDELQREGRERWRAMRAEQEGRDRSAGPPADKPIEKRGGPARSVDEERQQAVERWREYRHQQPVETGREPARSRERDKPVKDLEHGKEQDGPEIE
jgi:ATP-dependent exoDNAse (exonuclease V) alpha subunit